MPLNRYQNLVIISFIDEYLDGFCFLLSHTMSNDHSHTDISGPLSMGFSRQEYWSGLPFPSPGDLPDPTMEPRLPALQAESLTSEPPGKLEVAKHTHIYFPKYLGATTT